MGEKDLRKLNRFQLLELLIAQTERADRLQTLLEEAQRKLQEKEVHISSLGSVAEAALQLHGVFESAQKAADLYLREAKSRAAQMEEEARKKSTEILVQAMTEARRIKDER